MAPTARNAMQFTDGSAALLRRAQKKKSIFAKNISILVAVWLVLGVLCWLSSVFPNLPPSIAPAEDQEGEDLQAVDMRK